MSDNDEMHDIRNIIESVREEQFPDLDAELVTDIVNQQIAFRDDDSEARRETNRIISQWVQAQPTGDTSTLEADR